MLTPRNQLNLLQFFNICFFYNRANEMQNVIGGLNEKQRMKEIEKTKHSKSHSQPVATGTICPSR